MANLAEDNYETIDAYIKTTNERRRSGHYSTVEDIVSALSRQPELQENLFKPLRIREKEARIAKLLEISEFSIEEGSGEDFLFVSVPVNNRRCHFWYEFSKNDWDDA